MSDSCKCKLGFKNGSVNPRGASVQGNNYAYSTSTGLFLVFSVFILKNVIIAVACTSCLFVPRPDVASRFGEWRIFAFGFLKTINPLPVRASLCVK